MKHDVVTIIDKQGALDRALRFFKSSGRRVLDFYRAGNRWAIKVCQ